MNFFNGELVYEDIKNHKESCLAESYLNTITTFLSEYMDFDKLIIFIVTKSQNDVSIYGSADILMDDNIDGLTLLTRICEVSDININAIPKHIINKIVKPMNIILEYLNTTAQQIEYMQFIDENIIRKESEYQYISDEMKKKTKEDSEITLSELHMRRIENFKKFVETHLSHYPPIKESLAKIGDIPLHQFITFIDSVVLPKKTELMDLLANLCEKLGIDIKDIPVDVIEKIIKFLQYFCDFVEEAKKT